MCGEWGSLVITSATMTYASDGKTNYDLPLIKGIELKQWASYPIIDMVQTSLLPVGSRVETSDNITLNGRTFARVTGRDGWYVTIYKSQDAPCIQDELKIVGLPPSVVPWVFLTLCYLFYIWPIEGMCVIVAVVLAWYFGIIGWMQRTFHSPWACGILIGGIKIKT
jgi:hypothetical protein